MSAPTVTDARIRVRRGGSAWQVRVPRLAVVRELVIASMGGDPIEAIELEVASWRPPIAGWLGRPGLGGLVESSVTADGTGARVALRAAAPVDPGVLLAAALRCLQPVATGASAPQLTFVPGLGASATALAPAVRDVVLAGEERDKHVRRADDLLIGEGTVDPGVARGRAFVLGADSWTCEGIACEVLLDPAVHRPIGRRTTEGTQVVPGRVDGGALVITRSGVSVRLEGDITSAQARAVRDVGAVECPDAVPRRIAVQLNACGVLLVNDASSLPAPDDVIGWQSRSVAERRHALRAHSPAAALGTWPSVSVVMATHRPDHLEHAFAQLERLAYPRLEAVIGAHGPAVDVARMRELAARLPYPARVLAIDSQLSLGAALQALSLAAEGDVITKMDDDDHYSAEHVWDLVLARMYSGAQVVGKALDWVHLAALDTTVLRPTYGAERYADFVAGGTMLISRGDLFSAGGWRPVPKSVDRALLDRVLEMGGLVYRTHGLGYAYVRRAEGHTASVADEHFLTKTHAQFPGLVTP